MTLLEFRQAYNMGHRKGWEQANKVLTKEIKCAINQGSAYTSFLPARDVDMETVPMKITEE